MEINLKSSPSGEMLTTVVRELEREEGILRYQVSLKGFLFARKIYDLFHEFMEMQHELN